MQDFASTGSVEDLNFNLLIHRTAQRITHAVATIDIAIWLVAETGSPDTAWLIFEAAKLYTKERT